MQIHNDHEDNFTSSIVMLRIDYYCDCINNYCDTMLSHMVYLQAQKTCATFCVALFGILGSYGYFQHHQDPKNTLRTKYPTPGENIFPWEFFIYIYQKLLATPYPPFATLALIGFIRNTTHHFLKICATLSFSTAVRSTNLLPLARNSALRSSRLVHVKSSVQRAEQESAGALDS